MRLHLRIGLFQLADELLDLLALRLCLLVGAAGRAGIGEFAGALDKMQIVRVAPRLDIVLADQIERAGSAPCPQNSCCGAWASSSGSAHPRPFPSKSSRSHRHSGVRARSCCNRASSRSCRDNPAASARRDTRRFFHVVDRVKNVGFKDLDRDMEPPRVFLDHLAVGRAVAGSITTKRSSNGEFYCAASIPEKLRHQHGVLTAGDADRDAVARLHQLILPDSLGEITPDLFRKRLRRLVSTRLQSSSAFCFSICRRSHAR